MVRYLILRTLIFTGCLAATWLLGLRDREEQLLAVVIAAVASLVISAFVLKPFRQQASADIAARVDRRVERKRAEATATRTPRTPRSERPAPRRSTPDDRDSDFR